MTIVARLGMGALALALATSALPAGGAPRSTSSFRCRSKGKLAAEMQRLVELYNDASRTSTSPPSIPAATTTPT